MGYTLKWSNKVVTVTYGDDICKSDIEDALSLIHANTRFDSLRYIVADLSFCGQFVFSADTLLYVAAIDRAASLTNPKIKVILVTPNQQVAHTIRSRYGRIAGGYELCAMESMEAANEAIA